MAANEPAPRIGLCEHGLVRTLCATCRQAIVDAQPLPSAATRYPGPVHRRLVKEQPEARVSCATCQTRGAARGFVEDVDSKRFLCRTHAAARIFAHVTYSTSG